MLKKKIKQWLSIGKVTNSATSAQTSPSNKDISLSKYYHSIIDLPLGRFIDGIVDNNVHVIIISGEPNLFELQKAWLNICTEYADAMQDAEFVAYSKLKYDLIIEKAKYFCIIELIETLRDYYADWFKKELNRLMHTHFKLDVTNPDEYNKELDRAVRRSAGFKIDIALKQQRLDMMETKMQGKNKKPTREFFEGMILTIRNHFKTHFDKDDSVWMFCDQVRRLNYEVELMNKKK